MCPLLELRFWSNTYWVSGSVCAQRCFRVKPDVGTRPAKYTNGSLGSCGICCFCFLDFDLERVWTWKLSG